MGFSEAEYDEYIISYLISGSFARESFTKLMAELSERESRHQISQRLQEILDRYRSNFQTSLDEFRSDLIAFVDQNARFLFRQILSGALRDGEAS